MSGQKGLVARLSTEAEAQLAADLLRCRENAAELASTGVALADCRGARGARGCLLGGAAGADGGRLDGH